jgi:hypothetical protein
MKKTIKPIIILITLLVVCSTYATSVRVGPLSSPLSQSCDIPTWYMGDEWVYTADPVSFISDDFSFVGTITDFTRKIADITSLEHGNELYSVYKVELSGDISGVITWDSFSSNANGVIQGVSYIRMSDLAEIKTEILSTGTIQIPFVNPTYTLTNVNLLFPPVELYDFPLEVNQQWQLSSTIISSGSFEIEGFVQEDYSSTEQFDVIITCLEKEIISVPAGDFECFPVTYGSDTYWYCSQVQNMIKSVVEQGQSGTGFSMDLYLESYTRTSQPIQITQDITPCYAYIGQDVAIYGYVTDQQNNAIANAHIDITFPRTDDSWSTSTDNDGYYEITITAPYFEDDTITQAEFGSDGILVTCLYNDMTGYSVKTLILFDNMQPSPPQIIGQINGSINTEYNYRFTSTDPEDEQIYYYVDWGDDTSSGWQGPFDSGEQILLSHSWQQQGTYLVRAKAKDDRGAVSDWAELAVVMPKNNIKNRYAACFENRYFYHIFNAECSGLDILKR